MVIDSSKTLEKSNFLVTPEFQKPVCWKDLKIKFRRQKTGNRDCTPWIESGDEDSFKSLFPPRTKQDLAIRRSRASDLWYHANRTKQVGFVNEVLDTLNGDFDYIAALTIAWAALIHGRDWWLNLRDCGCFDDGIANYSKVASGISVAILVASNKGLIANWTKYIGLSCLGGYRNPPYPGFDMMEEARKLAESGIPSFFPPGLDFNSMADEKLYLPKQTKYISFRDFVIGGLWITAGASSIGSIQIQIENKITKIKARKNFVADVMPLEELYNLAIKSDTQINRTLIKSELGKIRLAVAGDLLTYLKMAWVTRLTGGAYLNWEGSNLKENVYQQALRMERFLKLVAKKYGLPYDYAAFDHQPENPEILSICSQLIALGGYNVPESDRDEYNDITNTILKSFDNSRLVTKFEGQMSDWKVIGGLMSGLAWTSLIGNAWNTVKTACAKWILQKCGLDLQDMDAFVRGDDSAIFDTKVTNLQLMNEAYRALGVEGGEGKFSIQQHGMEFLRVWYSDRCFGYPNRALPGLIQRKPWSNQPWSDDSVIRSIFDTTTILTRRGCDVRSVWDSLAGIWCRLHKMPRAVLSIPRSMGGFGIEQWTGLTVTPPVPKLDLEKGFTAIAENNWRSNKIRDTVLELGFTLDEHEYKEIAQKQLNSTIGADDVPTVSRAYRDAYNLLIKKWKPKVARIVMPYVSCFERVPDTVDKLEAKYELDLVNTKLYGKYRDESTAINDFKMVKPYVKTTTTQFIKLRNPAMYNDLHKMRKQNHQSTAIDWLLGEASVNIGNVHPAATKYVKTTVTYCVARDSLKNLNLRLASAASVVAADWFESTISQRLFCW